MSVTRILVYDIAYQRAGYDFSDYTELDIDAETELNITYAVADLRDFGAKKTDITKTVSLPGTKKNAKTLGLMYSVAITSAYNVKARRDVAVIQDGKEVFSGTLEVTRVYHKSYDEGVRYETVLYGRAGSLFADLGDKRINELDMSEFDHTYDFQTAYASWGPGGFSGGYIRKNATNYQNFTTTTPITGNADWYIEDDRLRISCFVDHNLVVGDHVFFQGPSSSTPPFGSYSHVTHPVENVADSSTYWNKHWTGSHTVIKILDAQTFVVNTPYYANWDDTSFGTNFPYPLQPIPPNIQYSLDFYKVEFTGEGYLYPMVNYSISTVSQPKSNPTPTQNWRFNTTKPNWMCGVYLKTIIDKIFAETGRTYQSEFFNSQFFKRLVIPNTSHVMQQYENQALYAAFKASSSTSQTDTFTIEYQYGRFGSPWEIDASNDVVVNTSTKSSEGDQRGDKTVRVKIDNNSSGGNYDANGLFNTSDYTFVPAYSGLYNITLEIDLALYATVLAGTTEETPDNRNPFTSAYLSVVDVTTGTKIWEQRLNGATVTSKIGSAITSVAYTATRDLNLSDSTRYALELRCDYRTWIVDPTMVGVITNQTVNLRIVGASVEMTKVTDPIDFGDNVRINSILPDTPCTTLLSDVFKAFNLYAQPDHEDDNSLIIEPYNDFFTDDKIDWTEKLDASKEFSIKPAGSLTSKKFKFTYAADEDANNKEYSQVWSGAVYGQSDRKITSDFGSDDETKIELSAGIGCLDDSDMETNNNKRAITRIVSDITNVVEDKKFKYRILYYPGTKYCSQSYVTYDYASPTPDVTQILYAYIGHLDDTIDPTLDLCFGPPAALFYETQRYTLYNLYNVYWNTYLQLVAGRDSKLVTAYFYLTERDVSELDFRKTVVVDGISYYVNKIEDYSAVKKGITKVELLTKGIKYNPNRYASSITASSSGVFGDK